MSRTWGLRNWCLLVVALPALMLSAANPVAAESIGVGLDWRGGIFLQEYWEKGAPHYLIANHSKEAVEIHVYDFDSKWRLGQALGDVKAGPWKVAAGGNAKVDAKSLVGGGLRRFVIKGAQPLGILYSPAAPGFEGAGVTSNSGLNGSGGSVPGLFVVQPKLEYEGGATAKLVLHLPSKTGTVKFQLKPDVINDPMRPANLIVSSAESESLPITKDEKQITIDTNAPKNDAASHTVVLTIGLPKDKTPRLYMVDGWLDRGNGGGNGITRGIWVTAP